MSPQPDPGSVFTDIYLNGKWPGGFPETASGAGSTLDSTAQLRSGLGALFASGLLPANPTILDAPCGDFNWFSQVSGYGSYIGMDIVETMVRENQRRHGSENIRFVTGDLTRDPLPAADVLLCRDCLIHLTHDMAFAALDNFLRSGTPFLLLTSHANEVNEELAAVGGYRPINFALAPFDFPEPRLRIDDHLGPYEKYVCLWSAEQVAQARLSSR